MKQELAIDEEFAKAHPDLQERLEKIEQYMEDTKHIKEEDKSKGQKLQEYLVEDRFLKDREKARERDERDVRDVREKEEKNLLFLSNLKIDIKPEDYMEMDEGEEEAVFIRNLNGTEIKIKNKSLILYFDDEIDTETLFIQVIWIRDYETIFDGDMKRYKYTNTKVYYHKDAKWIIDINGDRPNRPNRPNCLNWKIGEILWSAR
jgi:hypothetical protein